LLESSYLLPYRVLFRCPVIVDLHNIESELVGNFANSRKGIVRAAAKTEAALMQRVEAAIPARVAAVSTVSTTDRDTLWRISKSDSAPIAAAPNGVMDAAFEVADQVAQAPAPTVVFIAHLGWRPNVDGAKWLAHEVWPLVLAQIPAARLQLIGRTPADSVIALTSPARHVTVHPDVESVFPYLAEAAVATAPLWTAGGTRLKILEALATGTPVVATSLGALGLEALQSDEVLAISDTPQGFANAVVKLLSPAQVPQASKSQAARQAAEAYRWESTLQPLLELVQNEL
jgi:glycosyltransferase involved in cell wall biosynthesis